MPAYRTRKDSPSIPESQALWPVGAYARISEDDDDETSESGKSEKGVSRQLSDNHGFAALRRWSVHDDYVDNDRSAYKKNVHREEFERMLKDLEAGVIKGIVVYNLDRLTRQPKELERLIDIYDDHPDYTFASLEGDINLATTDGRTMARVMVAFANKASADTARRVQRQQLERARAGKKHGRRAFGWNSDGTVDQNAKSEILKAHQRILAGTRVAAIQADWTKRGVVPLDERGNRKNLKEGSDFLSHSTVRRMFTNPALAGYVVYQGQVMHHADGNPIRGEWEAVCTPAQLDAVNAKLDERAAGRARRGTSALKYLLSGIARCGLCGFPLRGASRRRTGANSKDTFRVFYQCNTGNGGCGKVSRDGAALDELIIGLTLADQAKRARERAEETPLAWGREAELIAAEQEHAVLMEAKQAGRVSMETVLGLLEPLEVRLHALRSEKRRILATAERAAVTADSRAAFDALTLEAKREQIRGSLSGVIVHPQGRGTRFDPAYIEPVWA